MNLETLTKHESKGGSFTEIFHLPNDGQVSCLIIDPNEVRGNHYHERKIEVFTVLYGSATFAVRNRETGNLMKAEVNGSNPMTIAIHPNHTHNVTAGPGGAVIAIWCDEIFDKNDPDTIAEEI